AFNKALPDTITLIANALRAGSSFLQAIELVVREAHPPISTEFGRVIREINTLTAQQRLSGYVVAGLPIGLAAILFVIAPTFFAPMFEKPPDLLGIPMGVI